MAGNPSTGDSLRGLGFALTAYLMWGVLPLYMKAVAHISPAEVVAHRILWSLPIAGAVIWMLGLGRDLALVLRSPSMLAMGLVTAALISINWGIYVWAIGAGHALDAALGYYINPLFSIFLARLLLGERLNRAQQAAIALAALAVALLTWEAGRLPLVALGLTVSWGFYAYFKRSLPVGANQGFFLEVLVLALPALAYLLWLGAEGQGHFLVGSLSDNGLLIGCGLVTAAPMMIYANGAKLLRLSTIGILQYVAPTLIFAIAVFVFHEPFGATHLAAFAMIWAALVIYSAAMLRQARTTA